MKRIISAFFAIVLSLALCIGALAEMELGDRAMVVKCSEYITLRAEPRASAAEVARVPLHDTLNLLEDGENGFARVCYRGQAGYVKREYLETDEDFRGERVELTRQERYNVNLFLSNFSEQDFAFRSGYDANEVNPTREQELLRFAIDHIWFNRQDLLEWGDFGEPDGNNVRVSKDALPAVVKKYFKYEVENSNSLESSMNADFYYYYWQETGGHIPGGFVSLNRVEALGNGRYAVRFGVYGAGEMWDNDACYFTPEEAEKAYPSHGFAGRGMAVIAIDDGAARGSLADRSTWRLERWMVV